MLKFQTDIIIHRPVSDVFAFVSDLSNTPLWQQGVVTSRPVTPGPARVGTAFEEDVRVALFHLPTRCVITAFETDRLLGFGASSSALTYQAEFHFRAVPEGTELEIQGTGDLHGAWRILEPILQADAKKSVKDEVGRIKAVLEQTGNRVAPVSKESGHAVALVAILAFAATAATAEAKKDERVAPVAVTTATAPAAPSEVERTRQAFVGSWSGEVKISGAMTDSYPITLECRSIANGNGAACEMNGQGTGSFAATCMMAHDGMGDTGVHLMCVTSDGEVHDHRGHWSDATHLGFERLSWSGGPAGNGYEDLACSWPDAASMTWTAQMGLADGGTVHWNVSFRRQS